MVNFINRLCFLIKQQFFAASIINLPLKYGYQIYPIVIFSSYIVTVFNL
ncbi:MAG: hypothetical protein JWQ66_2597 [Mucilaginibacter sp.]|jgi:hypothetical protein|nr:hypothetical protein [Mucilaginibacter sp.]